MTIPHDQKSSKLSLTVTANHKTFTVKGKVAKTLEALIKSEKRGITALELSNTWALRLSEYISCLRHTHNLAIVTHKEMHEGGWHGRYELLTPVQIIKG